MSIQEVRGAKETPAYQKKEKAGGGEEFQKSLLQNLRSRERGEETAADPAQEENRAKELPKTPGIGVTGSARVNAAMLTEAVQTAKVRHMRYEESDHVEIAVTRGYTLKGKRLDSAEDFAREQAENMTRMSQDEEAKRQKGSRVYVEAKYDDGRTEAYRVNIERVSQDTTHIIERFALETVQEV